MDWVSGRQVRDISLIFLFCTVFNAFANEAGSVTVHTTTDINFIFDPSEISELVVSKIASVNLRVNTSNPDYVGRAGDSVSQVGRTGGPPRASSLVWIRFQSQDQNIARVVGNDTVSLSDLLSQDRDVNTRNGSIFDIEGLFLGRTVIKFYQTGTSSGSGADEELPPRSALPTGSQSGVMDGGATSTYNRDSYNVTTNGEVWKAMAVEHVEYKVAVVRPDRIIDKIFIGAVSLMVIVANIGMGCKMDLDVVKEVLRRPFAPAIGFLCQCIIMPLMAFGMVKAFGLQGGQALGFFATGCAPGGGSSNMYTYLLNGDISLSVTMTLVSVLASLGMIPLWLFTLGPVITGKHHDITIPFPNIFITLLSLLIPVLIGLLIGRKRPKWAQNYTKILRPLFVIFILFMFTFGVYTNLYIFKLITPSLVIAACILPYTAFLLSGFIAFLLRQPRNRILTIAIETAIQNTGIPILLMKFSLPQPDADLSVVSPVVISMFTPLPLWIAVAVTEIRRRCCKKSASEAGEEEDVIRISEAGNESQRRLTVEGNGKVTGNDDDQEEKDSPDETMETVIRNGITANTDLLKNNNVV